jgi:sugar lactone lactonase YvrE
MIDGLVTSINLCKSGKLVITSKNQIISFDPDTRRTNILHQFNFEDPSYRLNDCKVSDCGKLLYSYFSDALPRQQHGSIGIYTKLEGAVEILPKKFITPNGIVTSMRDNIFWVSDTGKSQIYQYPYSLIANTNCDFRKLPLKVIDVLPGYGRPDGASIDESGNYWVALLEGRAVGCWSKDAELLSLIKLKAKIPTMPIFWGQSLSKGLATLRYMNGSRDKSSSLEEFFPKAAGKSVVYFEDI